MYETIQTNILSLLLQFGFGMGQKIQNTKSYGEKIYRLVMTKWDAEGNEQFCNVDVRVGQGWGLGC